jgi:DNA-directed RNA polymerase alpha subunit
MKYRYIGKARVVGHLRVVPGDVVDVDPQVLVSWGAESDFVALGDVAPRIGAQELYALQEEAEARQMPLAALGLSEKVVSALKDAEIESVDALVELVNQGDDAVLEIPGIGKAALRAIKAAVVVGNYDAT